MDAEDKEWAQLASLLLQNSDNAFPDSLHPYLSGAKNIFDDLHAGAAHDTHALFGAPDHGSVSIANLARSSGEVHQGCEGYFLDGSVFRTGGTSSAGACENEMPVEQTASIKGTAHDVQQDLQSKAEDPAAFGAAHGQQERLSLETGSLTIPIEQQRSQSVPTLPPTTSTQVFAASGQQQHQQPANAQSPPQQQQPVQVNFNHLQALRQQHAFEVAGHKPQQMLGLQQQLWTLQQQSALIAAQQQQQQQLLGGTAIATPMLLPMGLPICFSSTMPNEFGSAADSYSMLSQQQQQQAGFAAIAQSPAGGLQLYGISPGLQQVAPQIAAQFSLAGSAAAAATNGNQQARADGHHVRNAAAVAAASPSARAAAAAAVMAAATGHHMGKPITGPKKQRERQRSVVSTLEAEVAEKMAQLQVLSAENEMLKLRAAVLEATVANREDQMRVISEHGPPVYPIDIADQPPGATSSSTSSPKSSSATSGAPLQHSKGDDMPTNLSSELRSSASTAGELVMQPATPRTAADAVAEALAGPGIDVERRDQDAECTSSWGAAAIGAKTVRDDDFWPDIQQGREVIKRMSVEDVARHWKQFLQEVTGELVIVQKEEAMMAFRSSRCVTATGNGDAAAAPESSASTKRIDELVEKYSFLIKTAQQLNPGAYCRLFGQNLDTGLPAPYSDAHWRQVVSVLDLSKEQVSHVLACAELYFACRARLQNEQRALQQQLKLASASTSECLLLPKNPQNDNLMKPWLDKLANNLKREHVLRVMLNGFVWFKVLTPVQCAKAAVYSHPFYVDVHAMVCVMCEDALSTPLSSSSSSQKLINRPLVFPHRTEQAVL